MQKLNSIEQITELANKLGRKVSKKDVIDTFENGAELFAAGRSWYEVNEPSYKHKKQVLRLNGVNYRSDEDVFRVGGIRPEVKKHRLQAEQTNEAEKLQKAVDTISKIAEKYGVKLGLLTQTVERINKAITDAAEAAVVAAEIAKTAEAARIDAQIAALQAKRKAL